MITPRWERSINATRQVLGFVARRLASEPVALLATTRPGFEDPLSGSGGPTRMLRPLSRAESERLVLRRHPDLDERCRAWVLGHAEGNPLALTELPLTAGDAGPGPPDRILLTARLNTSQALERMRGEGELDPCVAYLVAFIERSQRGVIK